ncbi:aldose epimerase [Nocardioides immobilis]|uniref:Aldose epimerase n=1 Tax=Nocardioides immobilis TaxID=2049295 RepID=A0A417XSX7_9ACTN|nr:aldose 1-epimerase family protein [Nocardioides immobilis]RHW23453.1 aldose epimerase [Nocardioides immobilis]
MLPPSGEQFRIEAAGYAAVVTESGAALRSLTCDGRTLVDGFAEDAMAGGGRGQLLMPWPNRIRDGRYADPSGSGTVHQLALTEPKRSNASHGLARWVAWTPAAHESDRVALRYRLMAQTGYPWTLDLEVTYVVGPDGLTVTQSATNRAGSAAPYASGAHPYLLAGTGPVDDWTFTCPAATRLLTDDARLLPTARADLTGTDLDFREPRRLGATVVNDAVTDLARDSDGRATTAVVAADGTGTALWVDQHHRWLQLYTADDTATPRVSIAVEPMTAPPDAFNSGDDLTLIEPAATFSASWGIFAIPGSG